MDVKGIASLVKQLEALGFKVPKRVTDKEPEMEPGLLKSFSHCPNCGKRGQVEKTFGVRNMGTGIIRAQSWCRDCRKDPRRPEAIKFQKHNHGRG